MKIGWIGLGNMGVPMVKNLVKAGFEVSVYNRSREKAEALSNEIGVGIADSPADLVKDNEFIITMLADDAALTDVYTGTNGILTASAGEKLTAIDMSTVSPDTTKKLAGLCAQKGIGYLDAPVSGSVKPAEDAQLIIMVGGAKTNFDKAEPIFSKLGKMSLHLGDTGAGNNAKLAINLFLAIVMEGLSESLIFAKGLGIAPEHFLEIVNNGALGSGLTKIKTANIVNGNYKAAFALKHLVKDLKLAESQGMHLPAGTATADSYKKALEAGLGEEDMIAIVKHLGL